jgi:hypothetical protein
MWIFAWLVVSNILLHNIWDNPNPIDYHIFKMVKTANQLA